VAAFFGVDEAYIWPDALDRDEVAAVSQSEIVAVYPHRWAVPRDTPGHFFSQAEREIGVLVYSGATRTARMWTSAARPRASAAQGWSPRSAARLPCSSGCWPNRGWRSGCTAPSYTNSIYRADDQLLVNRHIYGVMANNAPVFHLRKTQAGEMANTYLESVERVWDGAAPYERSS
jgi:hypothetical protein